jgi:hypothetical protein
MPASSRTATSRSTPATEHPTMANEDQKKKNLRLALILASVALVFFLGFLAKMALLGK